MTDYHPTKKTKETIISFQRKLLSKASPFMLLKSFGVPEIPQEKWYDKILYLLKLKKKPELPDLFPGVKTGDTITFRRPRKFSATNLQQKEK